MLKWAMRIVAVGGALLALAVGTAAWVHRTEGRYWRFATPTVFMDVTVAPQYTDIEGGLRREFPSANWGIERYGMASHVWRNSDTEVSFWNSMHDASFGREWHGVGIARGDSRSSTGAPSYIDVLCPTWAVIAVLLLPAGLWAGIGWRQRRRVRAGHCVNCGYDLRATPEKCPECGRAVRVGAK